jgi:capsular polysaccharide biosynthesis protein
MYVSMLKSKIVEDAIIQRFNLMNQYHRKYLSDARKSLERRTSVEGGLKDGLIHISFEDRSPQRAAEIATAYVDQLRDLSQHLAISDASHRRQLLPSLIYLPRLELLNPVSTLIKSMVACAVIWLFAICHRWADDTIRWRYARHLVGGEA